MSVGACSIDRFFNFVKANDEEKIEIYYCKSKGEDLVQKVTTITHEEGRYFIRESVRQVDVELQGGQAKWKTLNVISSGDKEALDLENKHAYVTRLFAAVNDNQPYLPDDRSSWEKCKDSISSSAQEFWNSTAKTKWLARNFLLDTFIVGGIVGRIIAGVANKENRHYKTVPSQRLGETLAPLIFPGGSKKPIIKEGSGEVVLDAILHRQYKALKNYDSHYENEQGEGIDFEPVDVTMSYKGIDYKLETIQASNNIASNDETNRLHVIYFNGNSTCFQHFYKSIAEDLIAMQGEGIAVTARTFNYPGVLNHSVTVEVADELVQAGIKQVENLLNQGVPPEFIVLQGASLGGSISSHVAAHFEKAGVKLGGLYAAMTFASTAQVGREFFNRALGDTIISRIISTLALPFIKLGTWGSGWDLDTGKQFFSIERDRRQYCVLRSTKAQREAYQKTREDSTYTKVYNFFLRHREDPKDDEVLRRGLHLSWERCWDAVKHNCYWYGAEAKDQFKRENRKRKMVVVDFSSRQYMPEAEGHAKSHPVHHNQSKEAWYSPVKEPILPAKPILGAVHLPDKGNELALDRDDYLIENEAGRVFRRHLQQWWAQSQSSVLAVQEDTGVQSNAPEDLQASS